MPEWSEYTPYWEGLARQQEERRSLIAAQLMEEKLRQEELDRQVKSQALDWLQGYGTPSERSAQLYQPSSGIGAALAGGGVATNITPEGQLAVLGQPEVGPEGVVPRTQYFPSRDLQAPTAPLSGAIRNAVMKKAMTGTVGELPEETFTREKALQEERIKLQEKAIRSREDIAVGRDISAAERAEALSQSRERRTLMSTMYQNRLNQLDRIDQAAQNEYNRIAIEAGKLSMYFDAQPKLKAEWVNNLNRAERILNTTLAKNETTRATIYGQFETLGTELGMPRSQVAQGVEAVADLMRRRLRTTHYSQLLDSGVDAAFIMRQAQKENVSPEQYLDALIQAMNKREGKPTEELVPLTGEQMQEKWKKRKRTSFFPQERTLGERWRASRLPKEQR